VFVDCTQALGAAMWTLNNNTINCPAGGCPAAIVAIGKLSAPTILSKDAFTCSFSSRGEK